MVSSSFINWIQLAQKFLEECKKEEEEYVAHSEKTAGELGRCAPLYELRNTAMGFVCRKVVMPMVNKYIVHMYENYELAIEWYLSSRTDYGSAPWCSCSAFCVQFFWLPWWPFVIARTHPSLLINKINWQVGLYVRFYLLTQVNNFVHLCIYFSCIYRSYKRDNPTGGISLMKTRDDWLKNVDRMCSNK